MPLAPRFAVWLAPVAFAASAALAACGGGDSASPPTDTGDAGDTEGGADDAGNLFGNKDVVSIKIDPPMAAIEVLNGAPATKAFTVTATYSDQTSAPLSKDVMWSITNYPVGNIDPTGRYTASGMTGGHVLITAGYKLLKATAQLDVKLHIQQNPGNIAGATQSALKGATAPDTVGKWAYPYDATVFPRGLLPPSLQWFGGAASDAYYVHLTSPFFEYESFASAPPPGTYDFATTDWDKFTASTDGAAQLRVARWDGTKAAVLADQKWTIAPGSMRGTIYYWANNKGRVMRIKPGAATAEDFSAAAFNTAIGNGSLPDSSCTMTCHTVSADGSTLVSGGDSLGGTYDLLTNTIKFDNGGAAGSAQKRVWAMPAVSPNGKYMVQNSSPLPGPPGGSDGLFLTANGSRVGASGLDGVHLGMPAFSPDGTLLAYVDPASGALGAFDFNLGAGKASNQVALVQQGGAAGIAFPSVTPDAKWAVYHRGPLDTRDGNADLFMASTKTPGQEVRLAKLDGDGYPFAAGSRDLSWNFEPTFAPVASGGYFWVVFTSRRTYGNALTGDKTVVKQLWVAAIDQTPTPGQDPSHPPFRLPGQELSSVNMRGFWALDPCKGDGQGCASGTECCGGYCDGSGDAGAPVCRSQQTQCSQVGDRCATNSDCCGASSGVTCINHVCSEPPPK